MKNEKKPVLITIIILLIPCIILGGVGALFKLQGDKNEETDVGIELPANPNHNFFNEGYLYFYQDRELLGGYKCVHQAGICNYAYESIDDNLYLLDYYANSQFRKIELINNRFAFLVDSEDDDSDPFYRKSAIILYDIKTNKTLATYQAVKNYGIGIIDNRFIVQIENDNWGVIELGSDSTRQIISFDYDFIGLPNIIENNKVIGNNFATYNKAKNEWLIIDSDNKTISAPFVNPIISYNDEHIIIKLNNLYFLYNYAGAMAFEGRNFKDLSFAGNYVAVLDFSNMFYVYDLKNNKEIAPKKAVPSGATYEAKIVDNTLEVRVGTDTQTYPLN